MDQPRYDRVGVESELREDRGDFDRVGDVVGPGGAGLAGMGVDGKVMGSSDGVYVQAIGVASESES